MQTKFDVNERNFLSSETPPRIGKPIVSTDVEFHLAS